MDSLEAKRAAHDPKSPLNGTNATDAALADAIKQNRSIDTD